MLALSVIVYLLEQFLPVLIHNNRLLRELAILAFLLKRGILSILLLELWWGKVGWLVIITLGIDVPKQVDQFQKQLVRKKRVPDNLA